MRVTCGDETSVMGATSNGGGGVNCGWVKLTGKSFSQLQTAPTMTIAEFIVEESLSSSS